MRRTKLIKKRSNDPTLKPVGHQLTKSTMRAILIPMIAAFTSLGTLGWHAKILKYLFANVPCKICFKGNNLHICQDELKWDQMTYHIPAVEQTDCHVLAWGHLFFFMNIFFGDLKQLREIWFTISWVALHHLVFWLKTCQGDLVDWKRLGIIKCDPKKGT